MNWLNYHHLLYFKTIVEQGSIAKASEVLRIGQPAISMQMKTFEDHLQKKLFIRKNKQLTLTDTGKIVFEYAKEIFKLGTEMLDTVQDQHTSQIKIQIGIQDSVPKNLISKFTSFIYDNFDAQVLVNNGSSLEIMEGIKNNQLDLGILNSPPSTDDSGILFSKRVLKSAVVMAGSKEFLHLKDRPLQEFSSAPLILPSTHSGLRHKVENFYQEHGLSFNMVGEAGDTLIQKSMAISGNGIIPIMKDAIDCYVKVGALHILKTLPELHDEIWFVSAKKVISNPVAEKLIRNFKFK